MERKQIILINPWIHDFTAYDLWLKPLGLLYIASNLERHGYKVSLIDCLDYNNKPKQYGRSKFYGEEISKPCHFDKIPRKFKRYGIPPEIFTQKLIQACSDSEPLLIGITSTMTYWYPGAFEAVKYVKQIFDDVPVALGGIYATLCYEHAKRKSGADYVIKGPGEIELLRLARHIDNKNARTNELINLDKIIPAYHLYNWGNQDTRSIAMLTSKGCPFKCSYCASSSLHREFVQRPPEEVIAEMKYYQQELGITDIAFYDDALLVNHEKHFDLIADSLINLGLHQKIRFHTPNGLHIRYIDKSMADRLFQMNFKTLRLGFESIERENDSDHKVTKDSLQNCINNLKHAGFGNENIAAYVLMGLPKQSIEEVDRTIEFVHNCGAQIRVAQYSPVPGSADFIKMAGQYPEIVAEPLLHNKSIYYCGSAKFNDFETLKLKAKKLNHALSASKP